MRPVYETEMRTEEYTLLRPVYETEFREETVERTTYETETRMREERRTVMRPVEETSEREERRTVLRPYTERQYRHDYETRLRPVVTTETQIRDEGGWQDRWTFKPRICKRLRYVPGTCECDHCSGRTTYHPGRFRFVPEVRGGRYTVERQYVPNLVPRQVQRLHYEPETIVRKVPVDVTRYEETQEVRRVPVKTQRWVSEEQRRFVPETVQKPVVKQYRRKVPIERVTWKREVVQRQVPVRRVRYVEETREEQIPYRVQKWVPENRVERVTRKVPSWERVESTRTVPRTVVMKVPTPTVIQSRIIDDRPVVIGESRILSSEPASSQPTRATRRPIIQRESRRDRPQDDFSLNLDPPSPPIN